MERTTLAFPKSTQIFAAHLLVVLQVHQWQIFSEIFCEGEFSRDHYARKKKSKIRVIFCPWSSVQNYRTENGRKYQVKTKKVHGIFLWFLRVSDMHSVNTLNMILTTSDYCGSELQSLDDKSLSHHLK